MKTSRRKRLTSQPNIGLTASVTTAVPMNSQRIASRPLRMPIASRAGRSTISAVRTTEEVERRHQERRHFFAADVEEALGERFHGRAPRTATSLADRRPLVDTRFRLLTSTHEAGSLRFLWQDYIDLAWPVVRPWASEQVRRAICS